MVHVPTRGGVPVRLGPGVPITPGYGASTMSRQPYTDPMQFELEREKVLGDDLAHGRPVVRRSPGVGDWISFESHGETVVITRQPDGGLAAFHNVCRHRGPSFVTEWKGCGARRFTCPYHGWLYDTTGKVIGVPEKVDFDQEQLRDLRAPAVAVDEWGGWVWVNLAGPDAGVAPAGVDRRRHHARPRPVQDGRHGPARGARVGRAGQLQGHRRRLQRDLPHGRARTTSARSGRSRPRTRPSTSSTTTTTCASCRGSSTESELAEEWDHQRYAICHYVVFPNTVFNCNPEHVQVFNPIPIDVDRTRFLCWELVYPGDEDDPEYTEYRERMLRHWEHLKVVVGEDIDIYQQLARTKRSSAYTAEHPLVARVQDRALPREDGGDDPRRRFRRRI